MAKKKEEQQQISANEIIGMITNLEKGVQNAINTLGQTITDYVIFKDDIDKFTAFLKGKYPKQGEKDGSGKEGKEADNSKEEK